jgi:aminoglycoside phosphotransferase family enzyme
MGADDQSDVIAFLTAKETHGGASVERIDTHTAFVFLAGDRAYKLKRAVRFDYLDFSTVERRHRFCDAELRLNQRMAPDIYRRVVAVTREQDGSLALGGSGLPVDWLVEMNRFDQEALFDRLAAADRLDLDLMGPLATAVAEFHRSAEHRLDHGGKPGMRWVIEGNAAGFAAFGTGCLDPSACDRVTDRALCELGRRSVLLEGRRRSGSVRQCHGDLHLRNIVLLEGRPTLFDGVEFNDEISCIDVFYDIAFLLMDLWRRRLPRHANVVLNRYLSETGDFEALALLPLFLSCRAAVRAKTSATAARLQPEQNRRAELQGLSRQYLEMAEQLLHPAAAVLVGIGGFSGSGKSTLALSLAPGLGAVPGAVVLRSDEIRKRLCGVAPLQRLGPEGYRPSVSDSVYRALADRAAGIIRDGHSAIVDAVYARSGDRETLERVASEGSVPFVGLWLDAPESTLIARARQRHNDPSDADAQVIRMQRDAGAGTMGWQRVDASRAVEDVLRSAIRFLPHAWRAPT